MNQINYKQQIGKIKLSEKEKEVLKGLVNNKCQRCLSPEPPVVLEIHRIKRGNEGGTYAPHNILVLCEDCHKAIHEGERMGRK